ERIEETRFEGTPIASTARPPREGDRAAAERLLWERVRDGTVRLAGWDEGVEQFIARVRCAAAWFPEQGLITYAPEEIELLQLEVCSGAHRASEVEQRDIYREEVEFGLPGTLKDLMRQRGVDPAGRRVVREDSGPKLHGWLENRGIPHRTVDLTIGATG
ncbi:MAG: hypothetical protein EBX55_02505, partial [Betaproteobacteria bacterium]|nr:hypothetical protein [Betaproteobacteria bacterium]